MKLRMKETPEDFVVREVLREEPGTAGNFAVYRVSKRLLTTMEVQERLAAQMGVPPSALSFPALKDKGALATQYCTLRGRAATSFTSEGFAALFVGRMSRHLGPADLKGNWFTLTLRPPLPPAPFPVRGSGGGQGDIGEAVLQAMPSLEREGIPNYFDEQRFGSMPELTPPIRRPLRDPLQPSTERLPRREGDLTPQPPSLPLHSKEGGVGGEGGSRTTPTGTGREGDTTSGPFDAKADLKPEKEPTEEGILREGTIIGKAIVLGDAEGALRAYFTQVMTGDPPDIRGFKRIADGGWGDWARLFEEAPRSNHRSILSFLKDHPADYRKAVNLISPRLLPLLLSAYQSLLWNRVAARVLGGDNHRGTETRRGREEEGNRESPFVEIAGERLVVHRNLPDERVRELREMTIALPEARAEYRDPEVARIVAEVLAEEGLEQRQMKARILKNAFLSRAARSLLVFPEGVRGEKIGDKGRGTGAQRGGENVERAEEGAVTMTFFLPPGAYATLVVKVLEARMGGEWR